jgi:hypothetical protein
MIQNKLEQLRRIKDAKLKALNRTQLVLTLSLTVNTVFKSEVDWKRVKEDEGSSEHKSMRSKTMRDDD